MLRHLLSGDPKTVMDAGYDLYTFLLGTAGNARSIEGRTALYLIDVEAEETPTPWIHCWVRRYSRVQEDWLALLSDKYCFDIVARAGQRALGLTHFTTVTKSVRGHGLKVMQVALPQNGSVYVLYFYTMTEKYLMRENGILKTILRFQRAWIPPAIVNHRSQNSGLP